MDKEAPIRILIVDDQRLMREGLRILLELELDLEIAGEAGDGQAALDAYAELKPDVVLMDVRMPGMDGVEATWRLREHWPEARVIILTTFDDDEYVFEGLRAGALGYRAHRFGQVVARYILEQITQRPGAQRLKHIFVVVKRGEDDDLCGGQERADGLGRRDAVDVRHLDVHQDHVGPLGFGQLDRFGAILGLRYDVDVVDQRQQRR